jgi:hypothetical protein
MMANIHRQHHRQTTIGVVAMTALIATTVVVDVTATEIATVIVLLAKSANQ